MDIVYIVRKRDSQSYGLDFIFSLRSVAKHVKKHGTIHIYTDEDISFINHDLGAFRQVVIDEAKNIDHREANVIFMINEIVSDRNVSDEFLLMDETMLFTEDTILEELPHYYNQNIPEFVAYNRRRYRKDYRRKALNDTYKLLKENGDDYKCYDLNCPIRLKKTGVKRIYDKYYVELFSRGLCVSSLYCNLNEDTSVKKRYTGNFLMRTVEDFKKSEMKPFLSIERMAYNKPAMIAALMREYPDKQGWELINMEG
jgi:hypothetical protein